MAACAIIFLALFLSLFLHTTGKQLTTSFDFPSFSPIPLSISFFGEGSAVGGSLELNEDSIFSFGRAVCSLPIQIWDNKTGNIASFATRFSFSVFRRPNATLYADGVVFFLAPIDYVMPRNATGGGFTFFDNLKKAPVVAVEFDTFRNEFDIGVPHVGIDVGSVVSKTNVVWDPFVGRDNFTAIVEIVYDPGNLRLNASFTQGSGNSRVLSYGFDLRRELPEKVTIGFAGATGAYFERHVIHSWRFTSSLELGENGGNSATGTSPSPQSVLPGGTPQSSSRPVGAVAGGVTGALVLAAVGVGLVWFVVRRQRLAKKFYRGRNDGGIDEKELDGGKGPKSFSYSELARATRNFSQEEKLGSGGFGDVYKGQLKDPVMAVAVKRVASDSRQGQKEYVAEVKVISRVRHRNLVKLVGWCHERGELLLVYEFMPKGSLDAHLYGDAKGLPWEIRYNIVKGVASALLYLHEEWEQCVVHRDVKASNVMLDSNFNAKLGDFGLARLVDHGSGMETTAVAGTMGYLAPETATMGRASTESDVYSFGVLALEVACGRKPIEVFPPEGRFSLVEWAWDLYGKGSVLEAADPKLRGDFHEGEMERLLVVGLWCAHPSYRERPSMAQVTGVLVFDAALPSLPSQMPTPSYGGVSITSMHLASMKEWTSSSSATGVSTGFATGSSIGSDVSETKRGLLR